MALTWKLRSAKSLALAALAVTAAVTFLMSATAQDTPTKTTWMTAGFVRPGADTKVAEGSLDGQLGGTIYYAVYRLAQDRVDANDPYNTGMADLAKQFVPGVGTTRSPAALAPDRNQPKYLYLYQIVNDRGIEQTSKDGIRLAANVDVKSRDIGSLILKLPVDASAIQSWGYFKNAGFAMNAIDRGSEGKERPASLPAKTHIGVSANPSILVKLRGDSSVAPAFTRMANPVEFKASSGFAVDVAGKNLKNSLFIEELSGRKTKLVAWEQETLKAVEVGGDVPDSVELMKFNDGDKNKAGAVLRALFSSSPLKAGRHSVVVGFTSNMAPGLDLVRLQDADSAKKNTGIRTVAMDDIDFGAGGNIVLPKEQAKDPAIALGAGMKPSNLMVQGLVSPGDIPSGTKLVDKGSYKTFGGTVYFAVYRKVSSTLGDTWGVGRSDFDTQFVPGESYRATFSPRLDTDAEYLYLYEVVNDRGFHDLNLPQNKATIIAPVALDGAEERAPITREVASFSLFLRTDPRLITSWGYFDDSGFNVKVANEAEIKQMANDPSAKPAGMNMAVSSNLSILDALYPNEDKEYRSWVPPVSVDFSRSSFGIGKDTLNINANRFRAAANDRAGSLRFVANKTLDKVQAIGATRPDYAQIIYFDGQNPINGATIDGIALGPAEVARAIFKVEWLTKPLTEGQQSVVFGFTSNVEPVRAPVRIKDLSATINNSSEAQERTFLSPDQIKALAVNALKGTAPGVVVGQGIGSGIGSGLGQGIGGAPGQGIGQAPGTAAAIALAGLNTDAPDAALAVADGLGAGILPTGLGMLARGSVGTGVAISPSVATPNAGTVGEAAGGGAGTVGFPSVAGNTGSTQMGGGVSGGLGGSVGALGAARMPFVGGGGGSGGGSGSSGNAGTTAGTGTNASTGSSTNGTTGSNGSGTASGTSGSSNINNINFNVSQTNQQTQSQSQTQTQTQSQNQNQNQNQKGSNGHGGNVVPAPASLLLGLIGIPGFYLAYRRRRGQANLPTQTPDAPPEAPSETTQV